VSVLFIGFISTPAFENLKLFYVQLIKNGLSVVPSDPRPATPILPLLLLGILLGFCSLFAEDFHE